MRNLYETIIFLFLNCFFVNLVAELDEVCGGSIANSYNGQKKRVVMLNSTSIFSHSLVGKQVKAILLFFLCNE
jgi:hypothetical protein